MSALRATARPRRGGGIRRGEARAGYLFIAPAVIIAAVFLLIPIALAFWVSLSDWNGFQSPLEVQSSKFKVRDTKCTSMSGAAFF